jgi:hypothetical protein
MNLIEYCERSVGRISLVVTKNTPESVWGWKISGICLPSFATGAAWKYIEGWKSMLAATVSFRLFGSDVLLWMRASSLEPVAFSREQRTAQ